MNECFDYYFNSIKNERIFTCDKCYNKNIKISINKLPDILIIFIDYGENKNCFYDKPYKFEEKIDFNNFNDLCEEDRKRNIFYPQLLLLKT